MTQPKQADAVSVATQFGSADSTSAGFEMQVGMKVTASHHVCDSGDLLSRGKFVGRLPGTISSCYLLAHLLLNVLLDMSQCHL